MKLLSELIAAIRMGKDRANLHFDLFEAASEILRETLKHGRK